MIIVPTNSGGPYLLTTNTYSQSSLWQDNNAATWQYMNNYNADGSVNDSQTGTYESNVPTNLWIKSSLGSQYYVDHIVIGYDFLENLPGGWGKEYTETSPIQGSTDDSTWTTITTAPTYSSTGSTNGLVPISIKDNYSYIRLIGGSLRQYLCLLEFQVWVI